jgi:hypothetical protein
VFLNGSSSSKLGERVFSEGIPYVVCWESAVPTFAAAIFSSTFYSVMDAAVDVSYLDAFEGAVAAVRRSYLGTPFGIPRIIHAQAKEGGVVARSSISAAGTAATEASGAKSCIRLGQVQNLLELNVNSFVDEHYTIELLDWEWPTLKLYEWSVTKTFAEVEEVAKKVLLQGGALTSLELPLDHYADARRLIGTASTASTVSVEGAGESEDGEASKAAVEEERQEVLKAVCKDVEQLLREVLEHAKTKHSQSPTLDSGGCSSGGGETEESVESALGFVRDFFEIKDGRVDHFDMQEYKQQQVEKEERRAEEERTKLEQEELDPPDLVRIRSDMSQGGTPEEEATSTSSTRTRSHTRDAASTSTTTTTTSSSSSKAGTGPATTPRQHSRRLRLGKGEEGEEGQEEGVEEEDDDTDDEGANGGSSGEDGDSANSGRHDVYRESFVLSRKPEVQLVIFILSLPP